MPRSRKAFHFDLSVKELEANGAPKDAWTKIGRFLERNGSSTSKARDMNQGTR